MKTTDRRAAPRLRVQFRTEFADASKLEGIGTMLDLSLHGCHIESPAAVVPGFSLELRIYLPDLEGPMIIQGASVKWVSGLMFGAAFLRLTEAGRQRVEQVINTLMEHESMRK